MTAVIGFALVGAGVVLALTAPEESVAIMALGLFVLAFTAWVIVMLVEWALGIDAWRRARRQLRRDDRVRADRTAMGEPDPDPLMLLGEDLDQCEWCHGAATDPAACSCLVRCSGIEWCAAKAVARG